QEAIVIGGINHQPNPLGLYAELVVFEVHGTRIKLVEFRHIRHIECVLFIAIKTADEGDGGHQLLSVELSITGKRLVVESDVNPSPSSGFAQYTRRRWLTKVHHRWRDGAPEVISDLITVQLHIPE